MIDSIFNARAESYRLLAKLFGPPEEEWFTATELLDSLVSVLSEVSPSAAHCGREMQEHLTDTRWEELRIEHARLFVGPFKLMAPPYGSYYLDEARLVMGDSTVAVMKAFKKNGLKLADDWKELPDHISVELEFMYYLVFRHLENTGAGEPDEDHDILEAQKDFLERLLKPFARAFSDQIRKETESPFYERLARCLVNLINDESARMRRDPQALAD